jgi:hypothetical protein
MPQKPKTEPEARPVGRPQSIPADARPRTIRMTKAEKVEVVALLKRLRGAKKV